MNYFDTSALVKRFVAEQGSDRVERLIREGQPIATSRIAYAEVYSALARRRREGVLSSKALAQASQDFEQDWRGFVRVDLLDEILFLARDLIRKIPLRGFDAIHLASALTMSSQFRGSIVFVAADSRLLEAAESEGLRILNPEG